MRAKLKNLVPLAALAILAASTSWLYLGREPAASAAPVLRTAGNDIISRGQYLARVGDCVACHTAPNGQLFAGGRPMPTPFGNLYVPNITPDDETGIGRWSADDFHRMMHHGISPDCSLLYPAMPYASYTQVTREDNDAIYAYLMSVPPVKKKNREHELRFPFNQRELLLGWRSLYFKPGQFRSDPGKSVEWNRGAYLVKGLGHCTMCHTAINALGGSSDAKAFEGGMIPNQNWYAPSLTSNMEAGLGNWEISEIADLLRKGASHRGTVYGPMAEVVYNSLQYLTDDDVRAMAVYLKSLPQKQESPPPAAKDRLVAPEKMELGRTLYSAQCAVCHGANGRGMPPAYPPLAGNPSITMASPVNPIRMVLNGGFPPGTIDNPRPHGMPPFSHILKDDEIAAVVTYIRVAWGNSGTPVAGQAVNDLRKLLPE